MCKVDQIPGYQGNPKDTLHKRGRDAPDVPLHEIQKNLLEYLGTVKTVKEAEKEIEKKYSIKKDITGLWPVDDIKKAWGKTLRMNCLHENKRKRWSYVIILQMLLQRKKESVYDATKTRAETQYQSEHNAVNISKKTKPSKGGERSKTDSENSENDKTERGKKRIAADNAPEKPSSKNSDSVYQGNDIQQRKTESEYDVTKTQSELKEGLTASKSHDSPEETKDHSKHSAVNISKETKTRKGEKRSKTDSENSENDKTERKKKRIAADSDPGSQGIYIPLFELANPKVTNIQQENTRPKEEKRLVLIDEVPKFHNQDNDRYTLLKKTSHVVQYDNTTNNAAWVFEILNKETIKGPATVQSEYRLDYSTQRENRAPESLKKYTNTGFERGHLAAAANHKWCQKARDDTNLLSNIAPQHRDLNQGKWRTLENHCRKYVEGEYSKAYIYTGPLYKSTTDHNFREVFGKALPTHFFKVIILEKENGERKLECYEIPNGEQHTENQLSFYRRNIHDIEEDSGLRFTENNPENLRGREEKVTVKFKADEEEATIRTNVEIIPRQNFLT